MHSLQKRQAGYFLIEVIVSLALLAIMLLGLDVMQVASLKQAKSAYYLILAHQQLSAFSAHLEVLQTASHEDALREWNKQNKQLLPNGHGSVRGEYPHYTLNLNWGKDQSVSCTENTSNLAGCAQLAASF